MTTPWAMLFCTTAMKITRIAAAKAARLTALRQVGGVSSRCWRRSAALSRPAVRLELRDDPELLAPRERALAAGLLVRPRASIVPAWVPRCLRRRLRLVCAMGGA